MIRSFQVRPQPSVARLDRFRASATEAGHRGCNCHVRDAGDDRVKRIHHEGAVRQGLLLVEHQQASGDADRLVRSSAHPDWHPLIARPSIFEAPIELPTTAVARDITKSAPMLVPATFKARAASEASESI